MQSVSDDDVRERLLEKPRFELAAKVINVPSFFKNKLDKLWANKNV